MPAFRRPALMTGSAEKVIVPLRIGVLGAAAIARRRMLPAFAAVPETRVTAVAGRAPGRADGLAAEYGCAAVTPYDALLDRTDVDAVYIPTPFSLHAHWTRRALLADKHVLVEKPLTGNPGEAAELADLAAARSLVLMENVMFVHHGAHARITALLDEGAIGELRHVNATFTIPELPADDIRHRADLGGGALADTGVYPLRLAAHVLGEGLRVGDATLVDDPRHGVDIAGAVLLRTPPSAPRPVAAHLTFGMRHAYESSYELWGSHGRIRLDRAFTPPADHEPVVHLRTGQEERVLRLPAEDQVTATVRAFAAAALGLPGGVDTARRGASAAVELARLLADVRNAATRAEKPHGDPPTTSTAAAASAASEASVAAIAHGKGW
ncbi:Gfo/Idh/MocA family oxidoreductase [Streptomyces sp. DG2A-72]|uniref:Gfo/Idh/MocA family protein n=1 Tax=Streptomyces sp. DG2A-72 TaxID=3051386 RepID=UPI00265BC63E|nr:Gfo/Idh/MocA family oxidoreductase [Streptomyces sp. DG2A-72]MDO0938366.1 Gfo/Idh/MocA family oxidoreductase [Streptomyces sp. DG2A-72]